MYTWRAELALALVGLAMLPGCIVETCAFDGVRAVAEIEPPDHVALISVRASGGRDISIDLDGELVSHSLDVECPAAIYRFETEPDPAELPVITFADPAPSELSGGGFLLLETVLPPLRDGEDLPRMLVDLPSVHEGDGAFERWIAITTCGEAHVEVDVVVDTYACAAGNREPPPIEVRMERG